MMIEFISIGLDVRKLTSDVSFSADATVWEQSEFLYAGLKDQLCIKENALQLLHPVDNTSFSRLLEMTRATDDAALVSIEIPLPVFEAYPHHKLISPPLDYIFDNREWETIGYDVCDLNGFFSFIAMTSVANETASLFDDEHIVDALVTAQAANLVLPSHAPYVVVRLRMLKEEAGLR